MKTVVRALSLVLLISSTCVGQVSIGGHIRGLSYAFSNQDFGGSQSDTSKWIYTDEYQYFSAFLDIDTDSASFAKAIGDSLNATISYELEFEGLSLPYWYHGETGPRAIMTITISDTLNGGRWYIPLQDISNSISPALRIRFIVKKNTGHVLTKNKIKYTYGLIKQP